mmetsp:Transcript_70226/g.132480  ORF Transcript_70226/g.132480 Transcript_70226/m.132480 type:complete len:307 (+) Transcript_70226:1687-2607(+)
MHIRDTVLWMVQRILAKLDVRQRILDVLQGIAYLEGRDCLRQHKRTRDKCIIKKFDGFDAHYSNRCDERKSRLVDGFEQCLYPNDETAQTVLCHTLCNSSQHSRKNRPSSQKQRTKDAERFEQERQKIFCSDNGCSSGQHQPSRHQHLGKHPGIISHAVVGWHPWLVLRRRRLWRKGRAETCYLTVEGGQEEAGPSEHGWHWQPIVIEIILHKQFRQLKEDNRTKAATAAASSKITAIRVRNWWPKCFIVNSSARAHNSPQVLQQSPWLFLQQQKVCGSIASECLGHLLHWIPPDDIQPAWARPSS